MRQLGQRLIWLGLLLATTARGQVVAEPAEWVENFTVGAAGEGKQVFSILNRGRTPVKVLSLTGSPGISLYLDEPVLRPGEPVLLTAVIRLGLAYTRPPDRGTIALLLDSDQDSLEIPVDLSFEVPPAPAVPLDRSPHEPSDREKPIVIDFFYDGGCGSCLAFVNDVIEPLRAHFHQSPLTWRLHNLTEPEANEELATFKRRYGVDDYSTIQLFLGRHALSGKDTITAQLEQLILTELERPSAAPPLSAGQPQGPLLPGSSALAEELARFSGPMMFAAGVVDGVNPCALALAIFLLALLTRLGHRRRVLLAVGLTYAAAVYVTYFLLGLGLLRSFDWLGDRQTVDRAVDALLGAAVLLLAALQVRDVLRLRRGEGTRELTVQLPPRLKQLSHALLRRELARPMILAGAALAGCLVTLVEAVCTGQQYLPILKAVMRTDELRPRAIELLAVYNVGFVLPLVALLGLTWAGVTSQSLAAVARRHLASAKLLLACLLAALGVYLLAGPRH